LFVSKTHSWLIFYRNMWGKAGLTCGQNFKEGTDILGRELRQIVHTFRSSRLRDQLGQVRYCHLGRGSNLTISRTRTGICCWGMSTGGSCAPMTTVVTLTCVAVTILSWALRRFLGAGVWRKRMGIIKIKSKL
jgi:hypothetical protein